MLKSDPRCEHYKPYPHVVDAWKKGRLPNKRYTERVLLAYAHEHEFESELRYNLSNRLATIGAKKKLKSIESVSGTYLQKENYFCSKIPADVNVFYPWGNFFLYHQAQSKMYEDLTPIDKTDFTHQFTFFPGIPRLQRCQMIEELAKLGLLNSSIKYSWNGKPSVKEDGGISDIAYSFEFKYFNNKRIIFYDDSTIDNSNNQQRINHFCMPQEVCKAAPFNIVMESDPFVDFLTEKTYRTLAHGVIPLLVTKYKHYTYLQSLGFKFPQILLDFKSTIPNLSLGRDNAEQMNRSTDIINTRTYELIDTIRNNWSDELIEECLTCGKYNQLTSAKMIVAGKGIPNSHNIRVYYSHIINKARFQATKYLRRNQIKITLPPPLPYCSSYNHNDTPILNPPEVQTQT